MTDNRAIGKIVSYILLFLGALVMLFPFLWMVSTSLKTVGALSAMPPQLIPKPLTFEAYKEVWDKVNFGRYTVNSVLLVIVDMLGTLLSCSFVAFGLAMYEFKLRKPLYIAMLATLMIPTQVTLVPSYFIWKSFHALDTYYPLIIPSFLGGAFGIFLMHQYFKSLPKELYEAAVVDGYSPPRIFTKIYLPLSKPALSALGVFTFMGVWNNAMGPLIYLQNKALYTLPIGLLYLRNDSNISQTVIMAGAVIVTIPVIIVYLAAQKQFIQGIASTGLKG
ncbi:carbohydrate ABC transporter permease [Paenibacillus sp. 2RAB27]|uniref:carbohydrate ABC transporter permease n=1 Tax=Paenibacillus sp. 2RAB27 TaxID=3232991 RepID=UPI003F9781DA